MVTQSQRQVFSYVMSWCYQWLQTQMSHLMTKPTKWHVRLAKTQISLGIHPDAQADLSLCWAHMPFCGFVMWQLNGPANLQDVLSHRQTRKTWGDPVLLFNLDRAFVSHTCTQYEPCHEKTCLRVSDQGKTQTNLLSYRDQLESWNFDFDLASIGIILSK